MSKEPSCIENNIFFFWLVGITESRTMAYKSSPSVSDRPDSPLSPTSSNEGGGDSYSDNMHSLMTNSYGDISGDESMFDRLLSDNELDHSICDDEMDGQLYAAGLAVPESSSAKMSEMVKKSASNLTEELDSLVRQAYMESSAVHELADEAKEEDYLHPTALGYQSMKNSLDLSELDGVVTRDGDMVSFVADDLAEKIRLSSPSSRKSGTFIFSKIESCLMSKSFIRYA